MKSRKGPSDSRLLHWSYFRSLGRYSHGRPEAGSIDLRSRRYDCFPGTTRTGTRPNLTLPPFWIPAMPLARATVRVPLGGLTIEPGVTYPLRREDARPNISRRQVPRRKLSITECISGGFRRGSGEAGELRLEAKCGEKGRTCWTTFPDYYVYV